MNMPPGFYDVTLTATNTCGCTTTFTVDDFVQIDPEVAIDFVPSSYAVCLGDTVFFDNLAGSAFGDWTWDFGDGSTSTDFEPFVVYDAVGTYSVSPRTLILVLDVPSHFPSIIDHRWCSTYCFLYQHGYLFCL